MKVFAVNERHQKTVDQFLKWNAKHDQQVNENHENGSTYETRLKQSRYYGKARNLWIDLPKREQINIVRTYPELKDCY